MLFCSFLEAYFWICLVMLIICFGCSYTTLFFSPYFLLYTSWHTHTHTLPHHFLFSVQIVKVLNLYTPVNAFEERVSVLFIRTIQVCFKKFNLILSHYIFFIVCECFNMSLSSVRRVYGIERSRLSCWWTPNSSTPWPSPLTPPLWPWKPFRSPAASIWPSSLVCRPVNHLTSANHMAGTGSQNILIKKKSIVIGK